MDKIFDIGMGNMGGGTTIWNRNEIEHNDYKKLAVISNTGVLNLYVKDLPENVMKLIEEEQIKMFLSMAIQNFDETGKAYFNFNDAIREAAFFRFTDHLKSQKISFGETNQVPETTVVYDSTRWDMSLRKIGIVRNSGDDQQIKKRAFKPKL